MADTLDVEKLACRLSERFEFPKTKIVINRQQYRSMTDDLHVKIVTVNEGREYLLHDPIDRDVFPRQVIVNGFDLDLFINCGDNDEIAALLAHHYDTLLQSAPVHVRLPAPPDLAQQIQKNKVTSAAQLCAVRTVLVVGTRNYLSSTSTIQLRSLFTPTALDEVWQTCLSSSSRGYDLLGSLKHF